MAASPRLVPKASSSHYTVLVEGQNCTALVDSGAQVSTINIQLVQKLCLPIHKMQTMLNLKGMGRGKIPYLGYTKLELKISEIRAFKEDVLFLIIEDSPSGDWVLIQLGMIQIDRALELATEEINQLSTSLQRGCIGTALRSGAAHTEMDLNKFRLIKVEGDVKIMRNVTLGPFETCHFHVITNVRCHDWRVNVAIDPPSHLYSGAVVTVHSYPNLKPGSSWTEVCLCNLTGRTVTLKVKLNIVQVTPMNAVPAMLVQQKESDADSGVAKPL